MQKTVVVSKPLDAVFGYLSDEAVWASLSRVTRVRAVAAGRLALGQLDKDRLAYEVALESDSPDFTRHLREEALIRTVTHLTDTHDWQFSWDPRGLRLTHEAHTFVLGIPAVFLEYLKDSPEA